jgi:HlyD family secretion protein
VEPSGVDCKEESRYASLADAVFGGDSVEQRVSVAVPPARPASPSGSTASSATAASAALGDRVRSLRLPPLQERRSAGGLIAWIFVLVLAISVAWLAYRQFFSGAKAVPKGDEAGQADSSDSKAAGTNASAAKSAKPVIGSDADIALQAKGYIIAAHQILVSPKVSGQILKLDIEEGRRVQKGDVLAIIESTDYQADFDRAKATVRLSAARLDELQNGPRTQEISQAQAELDRVKVQVKQLQSQYQREKDLLKTETITQQVFEESESRYRSAEQQLNSLEAALDLLKEGTRREQIEAAEAELEQSRAAANRAEWQLGNCTITAPITGTILKKNAEEGNLVNPIAFNGSFSLCDVADLSDLEVELNIQERDVSTIFKGQKCRVNAEAYPDRTYDGYVSRLMPIADRAKGAIPVRVKLTVPADEEGVYLKPEMGAIVTFLKSTESNTKPAPTP